MSSNRHATDVKDMDGVAPQGLGGPRVEELGVLVALNYRSEFPALFL
jgi:hypothetical protein